MADVKPFRGIRYNMELEDQLDLLTTPPYDVIDGKDQEEYYLKHPYNVIRLELPKGEEIEGSGSSRYQNAAKTFGEWLKSGVLVKDGIPAIYLYQQEFSGEDNSYLRTGFIASLKAEPYETGAVLPHEETISKHKEDRLRLLRACHANFSSIFGLYHDPEHLVDGQLLEIAVSRPCEAEFTADGVVNRIWSITDQNILELVSREMTARKVYIADGHHRYETAVQFGQEMREKPGFDRVMVTLVNLFDPGLVVFPTHRMVRDVKDFNMESFLEKLKDDFKIKEVIINQKSFKEIMQLMGTLGKSGSTYCLYTGQGKGFLLQLMEDKNPEEILDQNHSADWRRLDVSILHGMILEKHLGIDSESRAKGETLAYTRDNWEAIQAVDKGHFQLSFLMNPTKVDEVIKVAGAGDKMPQKSTFFYPKLVTGLVINPLGIE